MLPSIRKTGKYEAKPLSFDEMTLQVVTGLMNKVKVLEDKVNEDKPKIEAYNTYLSLEDVNTMAVTAKLVGEGRTRLFEILREKKNLNKHNEVYQEYIDRKYFVLRKTRKYNGENYTQVCVTPRGLEYIRKLINKED